MSVTEAAAKLREIAETRSSILTLQSAGFREALGGKSRGVLRDPAADALADFAEAVAEAVSQIERAAQ